LTNVYNFDIACVKKLHKEAIDNTNQVLQIVTGAEVFSGNCFPEVGKYYPRPKAKGIVSQLRESNL